MTLPANLLLSPLSSSASSVSTLSSSNLLNARLQKLSQVEAAKVISVLSPFPNEESYYQHIQDVIMYNHKRVTHAEGDESIVEKFNIPITKGSICRLRPGNWINSEVNITIKIILILYLSYHYRCIAIDN